MIKKTTQTHLKKNTMGRLIALLLMVSWDYNSQRIQLTKLNLYIKKNNDQYK